MFTQQHYQAIARVFAERLDAIGPFTQNSVFAEVAAQLRTTAEAMATMFASDNPRFRRDVFMAAAGMIDTTDVERDLLGEPELDFSAHYSVDGYPGIAWRLIAYCAELVHPECPGHAAEDEPNDGHAGIGEVVYCDGTCQPAEEVEERSQVRAVMVGDDRQRVIDVSDLTKINDDAFCSECGQIGCGHGRVEV